MACRVNPICNGIGDRDDLHHARTDQPLHPLPDGGLGEPDRLADGGVRPAAVLLELFDDRLGDVVQHHPRSPVTARSERSDSAAAVPPPAGRPA